MYLMNHPEALESYDQFSSYRSLDSPIVPAASKKKMGWFMLFSLFFGLTCLGAINTSPGSIRGIIYTKTSLEEHLIGYPEVIIQSLGINVFLGGGREGIFNENIWITHLIQLLFMI